VSDLEERKEEEASESPVKAPLFKKKEDKKRWSWRSFLLSFLWLTPLLIALDQMSKWLVVNSLCGLSVPRVEVIPGFFYITLTYNTGSSFGLGSEVPWMRYVYIAVSWVASGLILWYWFKHLRKKDVLVDILLCFIFAGAVGNGIDRTFYWEETVGFSGVIDFFEFYLLGPEHDPFAIFNVADMYLTVSIFVLIIVYLVRELKAYLKRRKETK